MTDKPKQKNVKVRKATTADAVNIYKFFLQIYESDDFPLPAPDETKCINWIIQVINAGGVVSVALDQGRIIGSIASVPEQFPWSNEWILSERWLFIHTKYRRNGLADLLIEKVISFAKERNVLLHFSVNFDKDASLKDKFLKKHNMNYLGGNFIYDEHLKE